MMHSNPRKSAFKRVKHGHKPGDVPKHVKIAMRENDLETCHKAGHMVPEEAVKKWNRDLRKRGNRRIRHESTRSLFCLDDE